MAIIGAMSTEPDNALAVIVEADEAHQRGSRKGSREWVRHQRDPASHPAPPRLRWRGYRRRGGTATVPPGGWRAWEKKLLAVTDRAGHRAFETIANAGQAAVSGTLLPVMAQDAVLCTDMQPTSGSRKTSKSRTSRPTPDGARSTPHPAITSTP